MAVGSAASGALIDLLYDHVRLVALFVVGRVRELLVEIVLIKLFVPRMVLSHRLIPRRVPVTVLVAIPDHFLQRHRIRLSEISQVAEALGQLACVALLFELLKLALCLLLLLVAQFLLGQESLLVAW